MKAAAAVALLLFVSGGAFAASNHKVALGEEFTLRPGQSVRIEGENLRVRFDGVLEDSRCPTSVSCIWEGNARVAVTLAKPAQPATQLELNTNPQFATEGDYMGYTLRLVALEPYPDTEESIPQRAYRATFIVTRS